MDGRGKKLSKPKKENTKTIWRKHFKSVRNLFKPKKWNELINDKIIRDIRTLFEQESDYYKLMKVGSSWIKNFIEYESNGDRNKNLSVKKCFNKIKIYLRDIMIDLQKSGTWKVQLTVAINLISSKDVDEDPVVFINNKEFTIYDNANDTVHKLLE